MPRISNKDYITIKKRNIFGKVDIFVGGKPATTYRGEEIEDPELVKEWFKSAQKQYPKIRELHVMTSETPSEYATPGKPVATDGESAWCRIKYPLGISGPWMGLGVNGCRSAKSCAYWATYYCKEYGYNFLPYFPNYILDQIEILRDKIAKSFTNRKQK